MHASVGREENGRVTQLHHHPFSQPDSEFYSENKVLYKNDFLGRFITRCLHTIRRTSPNSIQQLPNNRRNGKQIFFRLFYFFLNLTGSFSCHKFFLPSFWFSSSASQARFRVSYSVLSEFVFEKPSHTPYLKSVVNYLKYLLSTNAHAHECR